MNPINVHDGALAMGTPSWAAAAPGPAEGVLPWLAVFGAWLFFGSFAVPMKWPSVIEAQVHPLIFQCYKTWWTFASSFLVLLFEPFELSWWGICSGFLWVPSGVAAVIAVQHVGIACGQAVWQSVIILVSLVWGFLVLDDERVHSWWGTALSTLCLIMGLVGMTLAFSAHQGRALLRASEGDGSRPAPAQAAPAVDPGPLAASRGGVEEEDVSAEGAARKRSLTLGSPLDPDGLAAQRASSRRANVVGLSAAVFNGVWGGSNLVPSHYAPYHGVHFVLSFSAGALLANAVLLLAYLAFAKLRGSPLPSPAFRAMALPGMISGLLWSAGNFCSLYAVSTLGQGIGYSLVQSSVIVSGLWGIVYYREMEGWPVVRWFIWCAVCLAGVFGLALERA